MIAIKKILVPTDFSEPAVAALDYGRTLAAQFGATLHVVHVVEDLTLKAMTAEGFVSYLPDLQRELEDAARKRLDAVIAAETPGAAGMVITSNSAADAIVTYGKDARVDLIVIGTHGRSGVSRLLLGSVAERVVRTAPCPGLAVHAAAAAIEAAA